MTGLRRRILSHPLAAAWLLAAALLMKLLVPMGYMPMAEHGSIGIELCRGFEAQAMPMSMPMPGHSGEHDHGKIEPPCEFSALGSVTLGSATAPAVAEPNVFAELPPIAAADTFAPASPSHLRPPLRGPPTI